MRRLKISLLHATYRRPGGPLEVRDAWLDKAEDPDAVEYLLSMDADDLATVALSEGLPRLINPPIEGVTAVRNWNAAAAGSTGDLLIVIADDLFPPPGWDRELTAIIRDLDPARTPFAVKLADMDDRPTLLRHPVVSRAFYTKFGLFSSSYRGVYCDDDLTARAFWRSAILDGRSLQLEHRHPSDKVSGSESHDRLNQREEYLYGGPQYSAAWSRRQRLTKRLLVPTTSPQSLSHWGLVVTQRRLRALSNIDFVLRGTQWCAQRAATALRRSSK